jgi:hypothetical protein
MRRAVLAVVCAAAAAGTAPRARALLHDAADACADDPAWVKNGPEPDKEGTFTDGSGNAPYSDHMTCTWTITGDPVVRLSFNRVDVTTGDAIAIWEGTPETLHLLGKVSGLRGTDTAALVFEGSEALTIVFETDGFPNTVAVGEKTNYDPGFEATFEENRWRSSTGGCRRLCPR